MKTFSTILCALALALAVTHAAPIKKTFPDTTVGFSWFLVFDTPIFEQFQAKPPTRTSIDTKPYNLVWGSSDLIHPYYRESNPNVVLSFYIPWSRDNDGTHDLAYWRAFKPEWVLYKCDRTTPAAQFTDPHIPLDISNPDVIDWQLERYIKIAHDFGYDGIAADNFAVGNALEACGVWKDGQWVQKYTGGWDDPAYTADALHWLETFYRRLTEKSPDLSFGINYSLNLMQPADPRVIAVMDHLDYIMDEAGFTTWGFHKPTPQVWDEISTWIETIQDHGKHYFGINEFVDNNRADKEWGMASYLMSKNGRSSMVCTLIQGYGIELAMPEYDALNIGQPMGKRVQKNGIWFRQYSNGLAVVNVYNDTKTFTLPNDGYQYKDVSGRTYGPGAPITIAGQTGIVMGATSRPATVTLTTASTATVSTTTAASVSTTSGTSGTPSGISSTSASATSSNPNPATSSNPNPVTTSTPNPVTTSTPNPATTSNPNPATTGNPNPATSSTPSPATSANPSATLSSATSVDPNQGTSSSPNPNPASTSTSSNPNPNPSTLTGPNPPSEAPSTPAPTSTTGSSDPTSAPSSSPATGSPATVAPESTTTTTTTTSSPPGTPTIPASTTDVDQPASSASSQSLSSFAVALALFIFAFLW